MTGFDWVDNGVQKSVRLHVPDSAGPTMALQCVTMGTAFAYAISGATKSSCMYRNRPKPATALQAQTKHKVSIRMGPYVARCYEIPTCE